MTRGEQIVDGLIASDEWQREGTFDGAALAETINLAILAALEEDRADEREACAVLIDAMIEDWKGWTNSDKIIRELGAARDAIRARSNE